MRSSDLLIRKGVEFNRQQQEQEQEGEEGHEINYHKLACAE